MGFISDRSAVRAFEDQDDSWRELVVYSEGSADWPHLGPIVEALISAEDRRVSYLASEASDPGLALDHPNLHSFNIGNGTARTILFARMQCRRFVMTLPDLGNLWLKRSVHPVEYVYVFHSMNSTHTSYRGGAFDNFDTILCVGPHHLDEIRKAEEVYGLPAKRLVEHGSTKLDRLLAEFETPPPSEQHETPRVLVAPTWGESSVIERDPGRAALDVLLESGAEVILRPHPMTSRRLPRLIDDLRRSHAANPRFRIEQDMSASESWLWSDLMVSDWSGAASEYAFALGRPVIFLDTPPKLMNPDWSDIGLPSFEDQVRSEVGYVIGLDQVEELAETVHRLVADRAPAEVDPVAIRSRRVFNVGRSASVAARFLAAEVGPH